MAEDDPTLRDLYGVRPLPAEPHVGDDDWVKLATGEAAPAEKARLLEHVVRCGQCARFYRVLSDLEEGARRFDRDLPTVLGPARLTASPTARWGLWAGLAAAATLVWAFVQPRAAVAPAPPAAPAAEVRGGDALRPEPAEPLGPVNVWPTRLAWKAVPGMRAYRVRILGSDGDPVWSSELLRETTAAWPAQVAPRPGRLYWQVVAYPESGAEADGVASVMASFDFTRPARP